MHHKVHGIVKRPLREGKRTPFLFRVFSQFFFLRITWKTFSKNIWVSGLCYFSSFFDGPKLSDLIDSYLVLQIASNLNWSKSSLNAFCLLSAPWLFYLLKAWVTSLFIYMKRNNHCTLKTWSQNKRENYTGPGWSELAAERVWRIIVGSFNSVHLLFKDILFILQKP